MTKRVTIYDISKKVGVSTATVYRALNNKPRVSKETRQKIIDTAEKMGFTPNMAASSLARKPIKIAVVFEKSVPIYDKELIKGITDAINDLKDYNVIGDIFLIDKINSRQHILKKFEEIKSNGYNGVVIYGDVMYRLRNEILSLTKEEIKIASIGDRTERSDLDFYVMHNAQVAGAMASELMSWILPEGKREVAIFTGNKDCGVHKLGLRGFIEKAKENSMDIVQIYEHYNDPKIAYYATERLIKDFPDIDGIYINTANSIPICEKLHKEGLVYKIKIVASDIFPEMRKYINQGIVKASIFQDPYRQGKLVFKTLYEHIISNKKAENILINPQIIIKSNLHLF